MSLCRGSLLVAIRRHPVTGAGECPECGRRFDFADLLSPPVGSARPSGVSCLPNHAPAWRTAKGGTRYEG
jgi:hypothetical protein